MKIKCANVWEALSPAPGTEKATHTSTLAHRAGDTQGLAQ